MKGFRGHGCHQGCADAAPAGQGAMVVAMVITTFAGVVMSIVAVRASRGRLAFAEAQIDGAAVAAPGGPLGRAATARFGAGGSGAMVPVCLVIMPAGMTMFTGMRVGV
ncbi:hypothetical protein HNP33_002393 [Comamonas odontotermitis]|uniref:Uncharacterized protein n=1 Tax=Comamonas odontotermitis TaxID=379895 RepID=A0ABR6RGR6_9BURK|nr:hypothetical protein [Comamonas odontotermitis]MBB6578312.1 hypothetical protein [Comamonas odontotermitis]